MSQAGEIFSTALGLIASGDADLFEIIGLSLRVTLSAVVLACVVGFPIGAMVGGFRFRGRGIVSAILHALMGLPPVVVGLSVYLLLSASGPLSVLQLLYTPWAMIIAQFLLVTPIVAALTAQVVEDVTAEYEPLFRSFGLRPLMRVRAVLWDARFALMTVALAGFGRAVAEVGAVIIVGGNINHATRVMTTAIALETSKGNLEMALALGLVLLVLALGVNALVMALRGSGMKAGHV